MDPRIYNAILLVAAALQIGNMVRVAAFARRRDIGIMRLVGASNLYIMLPFLLEALLAAVVAIQQADRRPLWASLVVLHAYAVVLLGGLWMLAGLAGLE